MSYYVEKDEARTTADVWRVIDSQDLDRMRELGTSCRPKQVATVYSLSMAKKICDLLNEDLRNVALIKFIEEDA